jgi:hypothetical protein
VFLNPRMTARAYGRFYDGIYRPLVSAFHGRLIDAQTIQDEQRATRGRVRYDPSVPARLGLRSMLDIGGRPASCGPLREGVRAHGTLIDPAPLEVEQARAFGLETITGLVEEHDFGRRQFDFVDHLQTVDHLLDVAARCGASASCSRTGPSLHRHRGLPAAYLRGWSSEDATKIDHPLPTWRTRRCAAYPGSRRFEGSAPPTPGIICTWGTSCRPAPPLRRRCRPPEPRGACCVS